mgnify:FL=1
MAARKRRERFPVAVIGPGALGLFYASRLSRVVRTAVIARNAARARSLRRGVKVGDRIFRPEAFAPGNLPQADWVIVLVKTHQTQAAARVAARMKPKGVVSLQNGLVDELPQGVSTAAAWRDAKRVVPVAAGLTLLPEGFSALARHLRSAGFPVRTVRHIAKARLRKLLANVSLNPITAVFGIRNAEVGRLPYRLFAAALAREAAPPSRVAHA